MKPRVLIIDGNLFGRKMFNKFGHLSSKIPFATFEKIAPELAKKLIKESTTKKKKSTSKKVFNKETGEDITISEKGRTDRKIEKILEESNLKDSLIKIETGILYGMLRTLISLVKTYDILYIVICYDPGKVNKAESVRIMSDATYKANRRPDRDIEFYGQLMLAQYFLYLIGIEQNWTPTYEADDSLQYYSKKVFRKKKCFLATSDHDLFQLLSSKDAMLRIGMKEVLYTHKTFVQEFGILPKQYLSVLSLCGCGGDNVKGLRGVGKVEAIKLVQEFGDLIGVLKGFHKSSKVKPSIAAILRKDRANRFEIVKQTHKLVKLYGKTRKFQDTLIVQKIDRPKPKAFIKALETLKFKSLLGDTEKSIYKDIAKKQTKMKGVKNEG